MEIISVKVGRPAQLNAEIKNATINQGGGVDLTAENIAGALGYVPADQEDVGNLAATVNGKLDSSRLPEAINTALAQAKASGEFNGEDGYTPIKGTDYFTNADKQELVTNVLNALPTWTGGSY